MHPIPGQGNVYYFEVKIEKSQEPKYVHAVSLFLIVFWSDDFFIGVGALDSARSTHRWSGW
jgi:hypothetical protein